VIFYRHYDSDITKHHVITSRALAPLDPTETIFDDLQMQTSGRFRENLNLLFFSKANFDFAANSTRTSRDFFSKKFF